MSFQSGTSEKGHCAAEWMDSTNLVLARIDHPMRWSFYFGVSFTPGKKIRWRRSGPHPQGTTQGCSAHLSWSQRGGARQGHAAASAAHRGWDRGDGHSRHPIRHGVGRGPGGSSQRKGPLGM